MKISPRLQPDGIALGICTLFSAGIGTGLCMMLQSSFPEAPLRGLFFTAFGASWTLALSSLAIIFAVIVRKSTFPPFAGLYATVAILSLLFLSLQTALPFHAIKPEIIFVLASLLLFCGLLTVTRILTSILGKSEESSLLAGIGAVAAIFVFNNYSKVGFIGVERAVLTTWRDISLLLLLHPILFTAQQFLKSVQESDGEKALGSFSRLSKSEKTFYALHLVSAALQVVTLSFLLHAYPNATWLSTQLLWSGLAFNIMPGFYWSIQLWRYRPTHKLEKKQTTSWIGMKTAVLLIDHDPHEECRLHLPALLYRVRQLQCEQIIQRTFSRSILSQSTAGSQISLALDPRSTASPCVEALTIMSVIYIDGLALAERRLKNLVNLLPLLDPDMAASLNTDELESLFSRLQGFFHLDYSWIDQSRDENKSQLDIRLEHLNARQRQRVLMQLSNSQWIGNFIWISEAAREQIKIESPYLLNAIERLPIKIEHQSGKTLDAAIFLIKYENLIPRLQHYYNFDDIRSRLSPLPMQAETYSFLQSLEQDLKSAQTLASYQNLLAEIRNYDWVGFQAKDQALGLVLQTMELVNSPENASKFREQDVIELKNTARKVIHDIGYASQDFHIEHLHKLELRQIQELQRICLDRSQPRFEEAWLILASLPSKSMDLGQASKIISIIKSATMNIDLKTDSFVIGKCTETFFSLARILPETHESEIVQMLNVLAAILVADRWEPEMLVSFLDKKVSLDHFKGKTLHLYDDVILSWDRLIQHFKNEQATGMGQILILRWAALQELVRSAS